MVQFMADIFMVIKQSKQKQKDIVKAVKRDTANQKKQDTRAYQENFKMKLKTSEWTSD